ncbi:MAG TPA: GNAT family N-acetyltransferase [Beijerinckiaceae bacterium]|nr:GNAT family N-acetyltransferase [Beijerinckiaceae bacterium]
MPTIPLDLSGYTDLPPGKIATIVTYLEMRARPEPRPLPGGPWTLARIGDDVQRYRALFRRVGEPWLWFGRLVIGDATLRGILGDPAVEAFALRREGEDVGLLELDFRQAGACELSYFGLVPEAVGQGAGRFLMNEAVARAFARPIERFFVHTCTLDHPGAVGFYVRSGFSPYKRAIEVADDPRLTGLVPRTAAPHVPIV